MRLVDVEHLREMTEVEFAWEKGIVPPDLGEQIEAMAGMRNVLVHLYRDVDYTLLYKTIVENLDAFERCIECLFLYLDRLEAGNV